MTQEISNYEQQAIDFLNATGTTFKAEYVKTGKYFDDDKEQRDIYEITLQRGKREYKFKFGNSINNSGEFILFDARLKAEFGRAFISKKELDKLKLGFHDKAAYTQQNKNFKVPTAYDVLASLTNNDPGTFEDFCSNYGYDTDSRKAEKTYKAVLDEWKNVQALFNDEEIEQLQEMQ